MRPIMPQRGCLLPMSEHFRETRWCPNRRQCESAVMSDDESRDRAAEVNEHFRPIELTAETVTRPARPQSRTVHSFLRHLREKGLGCVPEPLSLNEETEMLRYIDGESGGDGWKNQHNEHGLRSAARLLRRIHDASADWVPPDDAIFGAPPTTADGDVFVHGDPGPWNFVWRDGEAIALIDWDFLHRAPRLEDVAYALLCFAPMRNDQWTLDWHHFPHVPDRRARIEAFLDAYGIPTDFDVADVVIRRRHATIEHVRFLADQAAEITWIEENRSLFSSYTPARDKAPGPWGVG
jgi:hypothetical protein